MKTDTSKTKNTTPTKFHIRPASSAYDIETIRTLFCEYNQAIGISLDYQNFETELLTLPGQYAAPSGALLIAETSQDNIAAGCIALRPINTDIVEIKRLYVRPRYRGAKLGQKLIYYAIQAAANKNYSHIRLDTLERMKTATSIYKSIGFQDIKPYNDSPHDDTRYMELCIENATYINKFDKI